MSHEDPVPERSGRRGPQLIPAIQRRDQFNGPGRDGLDQLVPNDEAPDSPTRARELVGMGPAVETEMEAPLGQHPVERCKG